MSLKDTLKYYRARTGYTAKEFASIIGIPYQTYANYEIKGTWPSEENLLKIADSLNISLDLLFERRIDWFQYYAKRLQFRGCGEFTEQEQGKITVKLSIIKHIGYEPSMVMTKDSFVSMCREAEDMPGEFTDNIQMCFITRFARGCFEEGKKIVKEPSEVPICDEPGHNPDGKFNVLDSFFDNL